MYLPTYSAIPLCRAPCHLLVQHPDGKKSVVCRARENGAHRPLGSVTSLVHKLEDDPGIVKVRVSPNACVSQENHIIISGVVVHVSRW